MRVLLTGGLGFIGSHTVRHWLDNTDWEIVVLDSLRHAGDPQRLLKVAKGADLSRVDVFYHDLRAPIHESLIKDIGHIDVIVNAAADSHVDRSIADPVPFVQNNVAIALHALEYARVIEPEMFVQVSTDEVYGPAPAGVSHTEEDALAPSNPYSASKAAQEHIAYSYWRTYGVPVITTRTMNNFGEYQHPEKYVAMVVRKLAAGEPVTIHARPLQDNADPTDAREWESGSRVWLHASNHADAIRFLIERGSPPTYASGQKQLVMNIAGEEEVSNLGIVHKAAAILDIPPQYQMVDFHSSRPGHDLRYSLTNDKLRDAGWKQPLDFTSSFERTVRAIYDEIS